jgi:hypothetical protein
VVAFVVANAFVASVANNTWLFFKLWLQQNPVIKRKNDMSKLQGFGHDIDKTT